MAGRVPSRRASDRPLAWPTVNRDDVAGVHRHPGFRRLWLANLSNETGNQFAVLAMSVTSVVVLDATAFQVGILTALGHAA